MSYTHLEKRVADLEAAAEQRQRAEWQRELEAMTDEQLEAYRATWDPEVRASLDWVSDVDLDRALAGEIDQDDILRMYRARPTSGLLPVAAPILTVEPAKAEAPPTPVAPVRPAPVAPAPPIAPARQVYTPPPLVSSDRRLPDDFGEDDEGPGRGWTRVSGW